MERKAVLTVLGSNSAIPAYGRFPTCQHLSLHTDNYLIDCGEGAQIRMRHYKIKKSNLSKIFISHLHGDHIFGLPGLLNSMSLEGRKDKLTIYGPVGLKRYLETCFEISHAHNSYEIEIIELLHQNELVLFENDFVTISSFPVYHRIPTYGYKFQERLSDYNLKKEAIEKYNLSIEEIKAAKKGELVLRNGLAIDKTELVFPKDEPISYVYCADSIAHDSLIENIKDASLLYFETTYLDEMVNQAIERGHSTAKQSALLAAKSNVKSLLIGHYSSRYKDVSPLLNEAKQYFESTIQGYDGVILNLLTLNAQS